jgi:nucleoside-diphosphate-sugar epimerase
VAMKQPSDKSFAVSSNDKILVTGASGFIGHRVVAALLDLGFQNLRCLIRPSSKMGGLQGVLDSRNAGSSVEVVAGNLMSTQDCAAIADGVKLVFHLAAGKGEKSFADAFANSVVTTRNLLDALVAQGGVKRFVNMSSFAVYRNYENPKGRLLDETAPVEERPASRGNAYCFAKAEQDKLVIDYNKRFGIPYVIVRPGWVYGPGAAGLHGRVGVGTFGIFLHFGGGNRVPLSYVDNTAEAFVLAGLTEGVDGEVFNVVDDDLPTSRTFLRRYKKTVKKFASIPVPHSVSYLLCVAWERYFNWSKGQLPAAYNRKMWHANWKKTRYSNAKLKSRLGWRQSVSTSEGLRAHFESCRVTEGNHA